MSVPNPDILYEDNHLLALDKPAGLLTMGDQTGDASMVDVATRYLRETYGKPGNVFVGVVHRLDRPVSGVLLFAKTSKAASRLSDQFRRGAVRKIYRAIVADANVPETAELTDWLLKNRNTNVVSVVSEQTAGAKRSVLQYRVVSRASGFLHLDVEPLTGRSHQIRVQLAACGIPIVGDGKYGSKESRGGRISLHAMSLEIQHPTTKERLTLSSSPRLT